MTSNDSAAVTYFAPAARASQAVIEAEHDVLRHDELARLLLETIPQLVMILNEQRQVVAANRRVLDAVGLARVEELLGRRPGEILGCVHVATSPNGCGTSDHCSVCGAVNAILDCQASHGAATRECRLRTQSQADGGAVDVEVQATPLRVGAADLTVLTMRDISGEKRRGVLERTFFHDVLNIVSGLQAIAELMSYGADPELEDEYRQDLLRMSVQIGDEIMAHRQLLAAERGELVLDRRTLQVLEVLQSVVELYRHHTVARGREIAVADCPDITIETDPVLLRRVLGNLTKNALEATPEDGTITLAVQADDDTVQFSVNNPTVMPEEVKKQVFQRSFSTKGGSGRGVGTYSVKLLTERYLGGAVTFTSESPAGTTFTVSLPRHAPAQA